MVVGVVLLGAIAALLWFLGMRLRSCRSTRRHRRGSSALRLLGTETESLETEFEDKILGREGLSGILERGVVGVTDLSQYTSIAQNRMPASKVDAIVH